MKFVLLTALTVALSASADGPDGGAVLYAEYNCPSVAPADVAVHDGGQWTMSDARERRITCILAATTADRDALRKTDDGPGYATAAIAFGLLCLGIGYAVGKAH